MNLSPQILLQATLLLPVLAVAGILVSARHQNLRESVSVFVSFIVFGIVCMLYSAVSQGEVIEVQWLEMLPGLALRFRTEPLGMLFALIASFLWFVTTFYSIGYMRGNGEANQTRFYACFAIAIAAVMGIAWAENLFTLFVFYEMLTLCTYPLVTHAGTEKAKQGGRVYLGILLSTSIVFFLPAMITTWVAAGTLSFTPGGVFGPDTPPGLLALLLILFAYGIGKAAVMPFHRWLPAAMVAPTPVSALLHAVAVVKAGVFSVVKVVVYIFGIEHLNQVPGSSVVLYAAAFTIIMASVVALRQDNLKRRLAYSTIAQLSYVVLATMILTPISILGAALHIAAHAFGKITLFFAAGSIYTAAHKTEVSQLDGIGWRMPWTLGAFTIGVLSMIGVPPAVGFISKWYIVMGAVQAQQWLAIGVILASTLLNAAYFIPIIYAAFFKKTPAGEHQAHGEAPLAIVVALSITAAMTLILFMFPQIPLQLAQLIPTGAL